MTQAAYPRVTSFVRRQKWALLEERLDTICELLAMRNAGIELSEEEIQARIGAASRRSASAPQGGVAVIPLYGVVCQKAGSFTAISGGTSIEGLLGDLRQAVADPNVTAIVLDVDSPGGSVFGVPEAFAEIRQMNGRKRVIAVANPMAASAAYWIACACDEIVCIPSGEVGSVGVLAVHEDWSGFNEQVGVKPTYVHAGQYKVELNPDQPLGTDARAYLQQQIDATYGDFVRAVAKGRGVAADVVRESFGQGRMLLAKDAKAAGMIDGIATLEETVQRLARDPQSRLNASAAAAQPPDVSPMLAAARQRAALLEQSALGSLVSLARARADILTGARVS